MAENIGKVVLFDFLVSFFLFHSSLPFAVEILLIL